MQVKGPSFNSNQPLVKGETAPNGNAIDVAAETPQTTDGSVQSHDAPAAAQAAPSTSFHADEDSHDALAAVGSLETQQSMDANFALASTSTDAAAPGQIKVSALAPAFAGIQAAGPATQPPSSPKIDGLIDGLKAGRADAVEALENLDPAALTADHIATLATLASGRGQSATDAASILRNSVHLDPAFGLKLDLAAQSLHQQQPAALSTLLEIAAPYNPDAVVALGNRAEFQSAAAGAIQKVLQQPGDAADKAARAVLEGLEIRSNNAADPVGSRLAKASFQYLHKRLARTGRLSPETIKAAVDFSTREAKQDNKYVAFPLDLLAQAATQRVPGAAKALLQAGVTPATFADATNAITRGNQALADALYPHLKAMPQPTTAKGKAALTHITRAVRTKYAPPISRNSMLKFHKQFAADLQDALKKAPKGSKLERFRKLMQAKHILENHKKYDAIDPKDYDHNKLKRDILALSQDKGFLGEIDAIRRKSQRTIFGKGTPAPKRLQRYLEGEDYQKYLSLLTPRQQARSIQSQLTQLAALDPARAKSTMPQLKSDLLEQKGIEQLAQMKPAEQRKLLGAALREVTGDAGAVAGALDNLIAAINLPGTTMDQAALDQIAKDNGLTTGALQKVLLVSSLAALSGLQFSSPEQVNRSISNIAQAANLTSSVPAIAARLPKTLGGIGKALGPIANGFGAAADFLAAADALARNDGDDAAWKIAQGIGNGTAAVGGLATLAGLATGPIAIAGGIIAFVGWLGEKIWGDTPEENLLEELDLDR